MITVNILPIIVLILTQTFAEYLEECSNVAVGSFIAVADDCRAFIHCNDEETSLIHTCPERTYFEEESNKCEFDFDNLCSSTEDDSQQSSEDDKGETTIPVSTLTLVESTVYDNHILKKPNCSRHSNAYYPHHKRCEYYYKCVAGYLTILRCNFYFAWDYQKQMCLPYNIVQCFDGSRISTHKPKVLG